MSVPNFRVRRATLDDLPALRIIWEGLRLDPAELERRLTEFQIAVGPGGEVVGGVAFRIFQRYAQVHSEGYSDFGLADTVRPLLWERLQALALNHGIVRLWTREESPFWKQQGFLPPSADVLQKLPAEWIDPSARWLSLTLKDEQTLVSMEKELALFMDSEKARSARALGQARTLKKIATVLALLFAVFVTVLTVYLLRQSTRRVSISPSIQTHPHDRSFAPSARWQHEQSPSRGRFDQTSRMWTV
jgi:hypothetical protein